MHSDVLSAQAELLRSEEIRRELDRLWAMRQDLQDPHSGNDESRAYYEELTAVFRRTGGLLTPRHLDRLLNGWLERREWAGQISRSSFSGPMPEPQLRGGRPPRKAARTISIALASIRLQVAGKQPSAADNEAADQFNEGVPAKYWITPSSVGMYRKRLRDLVRASRPRS
jgi:hypothetical protein